MKKIFFLLFFVAFCGYSQVSKKSVYVKYIDEEIKIDGVLNEAVWSKVKPAKDFFQYFPTDSLQAKAQSEIRFLF